MKTHMAIAVFAVLFLVEHTVYKYSFIAVTLLASFIPDIDSGFSTMGKWNIFRPIQFFTKHRGVIHSFTLCIILSFLLAWFWPIYALPFFLGYALHLLADSFTVEGIRPFWPLKKMSQGSLRVGGPLEHVLFAGFCIIDLVLFIGLIF